MGDDEHREPRLLLSRAAVGDAPDVFRRYAADPDVIRFMPWGAHPDVETTRAFLRGAEEAWMGGKSYACTVRLRDDGQVAGM
ncbi:MAG: GNAT family N-acetyltransferase, partial [Acidimicrobiia bacterium]